MTKDQTDELTPSPMWLVAVERVEGEERLLREVLAALDMHLVERDGALFLSGPLLDGCKSDAEAFAVASKVAQSTAEATRHEPALGLQLALGSQIVEVTRSGARLHHYLVPITGVVAIASAGGISVSIGVSGSLDEEAVRRLAAERSEREYQERRSRAMVRVLSAHRSSEAVKVQRLLAAELTPHAMGVVSDVLEEQTKGARHSLLGSKNDWTRFDRSINHPDVFGDKARHGKSPHEPPAKPMSMEEAQSFLRAAALTWLERVAA